MPFAVHHEKECRCRVGRGVETEGSRKEIRCVPIRTGYLPSASRILDEHENERHTRRSACRWPNRAIAREGEFLLASLREVRRERRARSSVERSPCESG